MSINGIAAIIFFIVLGIVLFKERRKIEIQKILWPVIYFAVYRTKLGIKEMDSISKKHPRLVHWLSLIGVYAGVLGMFFIGYMLVKNLVDMFLIPHAVSGVALVLPFKVQGGFYVPFLYWIISIFVIATIHEFSHGVVARLHKMPIKSSGFAVLSLIIPIIPAAFVEPDEKELAKRKRMQKLAVFAAGPFSNILTGALFLGLFFLLAIPVASHVFDMDGVKVEGYTANSSAELAGVPVGSIITLLNTMPITTVDNLSQALSGMYVAQKVNVVTTNGTYSVVLNKNPQNESAPYLGVLVSQSQKTKPSFEKYFGTWTAPFLVWLIGLLYWLYVLSLGIGLFNLVPIGPVDGGQMSRELFKAVIKNETTAMKAWHYTSIFFFAIIMMNLLSGFF